MLPGDREGWIALLTHGEIELLGRMPWSSNATFLVALTLDGLDGQGIYKPGRGERPLGDFPPRIFTREVAAYELAAGLGFACIPETVLREDAPYGEGSLQRFIDADFEQHYFTLLDEPAFAEPLRALAGLDLLLNNADRKGGHVLRSGDDAIFGIDNGLSFHVAPKLRTVMWDFAGEPLPAAVLEASERLRGGAPAPVAALLTARECDALRARAEAVLEDGRFPNPDPSRRAHPWPLV